MVYISNRQNKVRFNIKKIKDIVQKILHEKKVKYSISIALVDNEEIRKINKIYLKKDRKTDVIAFNLLDEFSENDKILGEIVVSVEKAQEESRIRGIKIEEEILRYVVHGLLHLLGLDDKKLSEAKAMWLEQEYFIKKGEINGYLGISERRVR